MFLVYGATVREARRRGERHLGLHGRQGDGAVVQRGQLRPDRARRGGSGEVRPGDHLVRVSVGGVLAANRPDRRRGSVRRPGKAVSDRDFCARPRATCAGRSLETQARKEWCFQGAHRDRDSMGRAVLRGRALPPGLLQEGPGQLQTLPQGVGPRGLPEIRVGQPATRST